MQCQIFYATGDLQGIDIQRKLFLRVMTNRRYQHIKRIEKCFDIPNCSYDEPFSKHPVYYDIDCIQQGKPWYRIKFNNEVDKLGKTQKVEDLLQLLNVITAMMSLNPQIGQAIEWYQLLNDVSSALGLKHAIMSETEFKQSIETQAMQQAQMMEAQTRMLSSQANRNNAAAYKDVETAYAE